MPLITCPDCQAKISDAALSCIKCGRPMEAKSIVQPSNDETPTDSTAQDSLESNQSPMGATYWGYINLFPTFIMLLLLFDIFNLK